jgi:enoyl-CoA hydratase
MAAFIAGITLNRPEVLNSNDDDVPLELAAAVERADADEGAHGSCRSAISAKRCAVY